MDMSLLLSTRATRVGAQGVREQSEACPVPVPLVIRKRTAVVVDVG